MLNNAASVSEKSSTVRILPSLLVALVVFGAAFGLLASSASALDGIDLSSPAAPVAEGACSRLVQIKYPFLSCENGEIGQSAANETWANSRHLPLQGSWIEGDSYWGPTLNPVDYMADGAE